GKECEASISFHQDSERYFIDSPDLDTLFSSDEEELRHGLVRYLNKMQSFRVIPKSEGSFYTLGEFYKPILRFGHRYDDSQFGLLRILHTAQCVQDIGSEKGQQCLSDGSSWDPLSLFAIIDSLGHGHGLEGLFQDPDILVCDDLEKEVADFILADTKKPRVVFIHAKGKGNGGASGKYAASPLQEVCGQATKNLKYFARYGDEIPDKAKKWHTAEWSGAKGVVGKVKKRIRKSPSHLSTGLELWKAIRAIIRDPLADLEVWLFLGRMFSKSSFKKELRANSPKTEAKQAAYLLF